jgi:peptidylamidoglycolate lyase
LVGQVVRKYTPEGRVLMVVGQEGKPGNNDSRDAFNRPTNVAFAPNGYFYVSDGYVNSRVVRFSKDGKYIGQWGRKGTGDGEFDLVHDIVLDKQNRLLVAERTNERIQIFDLEGKLLGKWTGMGGPGKAPRQFDQPHEIAVDSAGAIYVAEVANQRVQKFVKP